MGPDAEESAAKGPILEDARLGIHSSPMSAMSAKPSSRPAIVNPIEIETLEFHNSKVPPAENQELLSARAVNPVRRPNTARRRKNDNHSGEGGSKASFSQQQQQQQQGGLRNLLGLAGDVSAAGEILQHAASSDPLLAILTKKTFSLNDELMLAAESGDMSKLSNLLSNQTSSNTTTLLNPSSTILASSSDSSTPLHQAASRNRFQAAAALLLAGAPVDARNKSGETPLHLACYGGHMTLAELLIDHCASIDALNEYGETPLHYAARRGNAGSVRMLLQRGADTSVESSLGDRAEDEAEGKRVLEAFESYKTDNEGGGGGRGVDRGLKGIKRLTNKTLLNMLGFLNAKELCRAASVCGRWHRMCEDPGLWKRLGVRRWELALAGSMGGLVGGMGGLGGSSNSGSKLGSKSNSRSSSRANSRPSSRPNSRPNSSGEGGGGMGALDAFQAPPMAMFRPALGGGGRKKR
ncbi:hypothetical protein TrRE_jg8147 [Triparma retinervis]|uniref:F-box domain-containing protein n=1 Tax=Triparma retinervis TaxID=2557542 RepID=A0A9W7CE93_9STRA|nr:hypothetical protein TrRE_jg8147 [Triparma retinervis]